MTKKKLPPMQMMRATWLQPHRFTTQEAALANALDELIRHDLYIDRVEGNSFHCVELQHAIRVLNAVADREIYSEEFGYAEEETND